jgi:Rrf2 family protein
MFTQRTEYALRAIVWLARSPATAQTTERIAEAAQVPGEYLFKILRQLSRAGLVHAQRGKGGGVSLARPPMNITVLDVVAAIDPVQRVVSCPLGLVEHRVSLCPLHRRLDEGLAQMEAALRQTTLAEIADECIGDAQALVASPSRRGTSRNRKSVRSTKTGRRKRSE